MIIVLLHFYTNTKMRLVKSYTYEGTTLKLYTTVQFSGDDVYPRPRMLWQLKINWLQWHDSAHYAEIIKLRPVKTNNVSTMCPH